MDKVIFLKNTETIYNVHFYQIGENQVRLIFSDTVPSDDVLLSGFNLINENNGLIQTQRTDYTTKYRTYPDSRNKVELCNNGIVWVAPTHTVNFTINGNGSLEGETEQVVGMYEDLVVPTIKSEEGFEFDKWIPEIPESGEVLTNNTFTASLIDKNIYFHVSGGGTLKGETRQFVDNYSKLVVPEVLPNENYKFVSWMPAIPEDGEIDMDNRDFYAVLESNIPDRVKTIESDLTDTQLGLVENYESALTAMEEVTDLQLALVEIYNLITGGV